MLVLDIESVWYRAVREGGVGTHRAPGPWGVFVEAVEYQPRVWEAPGRAINDNHRAWAQPRG